MPENKTLDELRRKIDAIDDQLHDLIMERTKLVEGVTAQKQGERIKIRPSREAQILHRLLGRHSGPFPKREVVRIWRELIVATLKMEGPFSVAVFTDENGDGFWDIARDQYGSFTPMKPFDSVRRIVEAVSAQEATLGILPMPVRGDEDPWWRRLCTTGEGTPRIVGKLPFAGPGNARSGKQEALVICPVSLEPTGRDRTFLSFELTGDVSPTRFGKALKAAGLEAVSYADWHDPIRPEIWLKLSEVEGFVTEDDARIRDLEDRLDGAVTRVVCLGGYALPPAQKDLD